MKNGNEKLCRNGGTTAIFSFFSDGPVFRRRPQSVQVDIGAQATLTCDVDGNPPAEIVWFHENSRKVRSLTR